MIANLQIHQEVIYSWVLAMIKKIFGLEKDYNYHPNTPVKEGIKQFIDWYKEYYKIA